MENIQQLSSTESRLVHSMQLLGDATRYKIFKLLLADKELCVGEIANLLSISPSAVSQHFKQFEMLHLVERKRMGQKICYCINLNDDFVKSMLTITKEN